MPADCTERTLGQPRRRRVDSSHHPWGQVRLLNEMNCHKRHLALAIVLCILDTGLYVSYGYWKAECIRNLWEQVESFEDEKQWDSVLATLRRIRELNPLATRAWTYHA